MFDITSTDLVRNRRAVGRFGTKVPLLLDNNNYVVTCQMSETFWESKTLGNSPEPGG